MNYQEKITKAFNDRFGNHNPRLFFSPGRINFIGEHIDYNAGFVMPAAIDKGVWLAVAANESDTSNFIAADINETYSVALNNVAKADGWKNYLLGVLHILQQDGFSVKGFDCVFGGNLPQGSGLSSSAAIEAGLLFALNEIFSFGLSRLQMAKMAQRAEHSYPNAQVGIMDMFASLHGKKDRLILLDCTSLEYQYLPFSSEDYDVVLINTKVHHTLAGSEYNTRRNECAEGLEILKGIDKSINTFRDVKPELVIENKTSFPENIYMRCLFVTQEIARTQKAAELLKQNDIKAFGKLMFETHEGLSKLYEVSCPELDFLVDAVKGNDAVIGSRVMGGGFGGCTINLIEKKGREQIVAAVSAKYQKQFNINPEVYIVSPEEGTHEL
ncbi:galactokinase [Chitinophagaceae bacterium LWZ2-11]